MAPGQVAELWGAGGVKDFGVLPSSAWLLAQS